MLRIFMVLLLLMTYGYAVEESTSSDEVKVTSEKKKKTLSGKKLVVFVSSVDLQKAGYGFRYCFEWCKTGGRGDCCNWC